MVEEIIDRIRKAADEFEELEQKFKNKEIEKLRKKAQNKIDDKKELIEENWSGDNICPTCGQELPEEQVEEKREEYNQNKAEKIEELTTEIEEINEQGTNLAEEIEQLKNDTQAQFLPYQLML